MKAELEEFKRNINLRTSKEPPMLFEDVMNLPNLKSSNI